MCGRYSLADVEADILAALACDLSSEGFQWSPTYSIAPRTRAPIVRDRLTGEGRERELSLAKWGLHPSWAKAEGPRPINARLETVASNGMFRTAFATGRVLVPMTGYFEWQEAKEQGKPVKNPTYIYSASDDLLAAAGLLASRQDETTGDWQSTFTIITRTGEDAAGAVHDRMPVFLTPAVWDQWLDPEKPADRDTLIDVIDSDSRAVAATLDTRPVSRAVNNVKTLNRTDPALIEPIP